MFKAMQVSNNPLRNRVARRFIIPPPRMAKNLARVFRALPREVKDSLKMKGGISLKINFDCGVNGGIKMALSLFQGVQYVLERRSSRIFDSCNRSSVGFTESHSWRGCQARDVLQRRS